MLAKEPIKQSDCRHCNFLLFLLTAGHKYMSHQNVIFPPNTVNGPFDLLMAWRSCARSQVMRKDNYRLALVGAWFPLFISMVPTTKLPLCMFK